MMIPFLNLVGRFVLRIKDAFKTDIVSFIRSFIISSLLLFILCHFIPKENLPWHISEYILEIFLFMIVYPTMILLLWCPTRKEKQKAFSIILKFFLQVLIAFLLVIIPPLFFNYLALWITGCFSLIKTIKFWIFVLLEIFAYGLMLSFNLDLTIILLWSLACEIYLLFWICNITNKNREKRTK